MNYLTPMYNAITKHDPIWRPYQFRRVQVTTRKVSDGSTISFSILSDCYSKYRSGPDLFVLADAVTEILAVHGFFAPIMVRLDSADLVN